MVRSASAFLVYLATAITTLGVVPVAMSRQLNSYATVNDDASLNIRGNQVYLHGVYIPKTRESCIGRTKPDCRTRAAEALEFRIRGFVECELALKLATSVYSGYCYGDRSTFDAGIDLGAYLIERGWALAGPNAPFEYQSLEKLARETDLGLWGNGRIWTHRGYR